MPKNVGNIFGPVLEARSRIYTQLFTSSIWVSLVESVTRKCPNMSFKTEYLELDVVWLN